jgi:hypothetical protein
MRAAAALLAAAATLQGCSKAEGERNGIYRATVEELVRAFREPGLPVCAALSGQRPLARRGWAFIEAPPPSGFEDLAGAGAVEGALSLEPFRPKPPARWFIPADARELCFQLTRPAVHDRRAVVTGAFVAGGKDVEGTWNFWLRREGGRWSVVATTRGRHDI